MVVLLWAAIAPFVLWPIEQVFAYPYVVEELAKGIVLSFIPEKTTWKGKLFYAFMSGILFSVTETILYSLNIFPSGNLQTLLIRFLATGTLHSITSVVIIIPALKSKKLIIFGIISAMIIHYLYNSLPRW